MRSIDGDGNRNLIRAAEAQGVKHFVLVCVHGAGPAHPMSVFRMKHQAEVALTASRLEWTIIRPTAFMQQQTARVSPIGGPARFLRSSSA